MLISNAHNVTSKIIKTLSVSPIDRIRDHIDGQRRRLIMPAFRPLNMRTARSKKLILCFFIPVSS